MSSIIKATEKDALLLSILVRQTFQQSHGHSAKQEDIDAYMDEQYKEEVFMKELLDLDNIYHILYHDDDPVGYSKMVLNCPHPAYAEQSIAKLERIYILEEFLAKKLGLELFNFNVQLAITNNQQGIWLNVWKENERAIRFYTKAGFEIVGSKDFRISAMHSNPNHQMLLKF